MTRLCGSALAVIVLSLSALLATAQDADKKVFVTVLDADGNPIEGLKPEHFAVREGGKDRSVVNVEPLTIPMHIAVLVDTSSVNGSQDEALRSSIIEFVERLAVSNQVALYAFGDRPAVVVSFTDNAARLREGATNMFGWSHERSTLIDAVDLALRDLRELEARRPVIVAISSEGPEVSSRTAGAVIKRLIEQSTAFHAISLGARVAMTATRMTNNVPINSERMRGMTASGEGDRERDQLLAQGTALTGGGRQRLTSVMALRPALTRMFRELSNSYLVTFSRQGGDRVKDLQVGIMVEGVTLRATAAPFKTR